MGKKLEITQKIKDAVIRSTGDADYDFSKISVFEATALNTLPVTKRGLFDGAVTSENTLRLMAQYVSNGSENAVPMHIVHADYELPIGRVFHAEVAPDEKGVPSLQALFFLGNEHEKIVAGVDNGSTDEVSVGMRPAHLNCSLCGFDFLGAESTMDNVWDATCANDHVMGQDGAYAILNGLDTWLELSLVPHGAGKNAKIRSRTKSLLGNDAYEKLAASGIAPEITTFYASLKQKPSTEPELDMDLKEALTLNATLHGNVAVANHKVTTLEASVTSLTTENTELKTKVSTLEAAAKDAPAMETVKAKLSATEEALKVSTAALRKEADRLCVVLNADKLAETATVAELTASIDANRAKVKETFTPIETTDTTLVASSKATAASFKTAR